MLGNSLAKITEKKSLYRHWKLDLLLPKLAMLWICGIIYSHIPKHLQ